MNITFLIGNGFDRNLGLRTAYSDFVKVYKDSEATTDILREFRKFISENEELWSAAEEEMGRYTAKFATGAGALFYQCHKDFCENLAAYLKKESQKMDYQIMAQDIAKAFSRIGSIIAAFPTQEREELNSLYRNHKNENITFHFVIFNYTDTVVKCLATIKNKQDVLGVHQFGSITHKHTIGDMCHVHGTVDTQMVFGVNDKSQISKPEIFDCEFGDLYEDILIKRQANMGYQENTDSRAAKIINRSDLIYIYGMSIGITDTIWWERVCTWLKGNSERHLIVQRHSMPPRGLLEVDYKIEERKSKQAVTRFSQLEESENRKIENRIHITSENIFSDLKNIATKAELDEETLQRLYSSVADAQASIAKSAAFQIASDYIDRHNEELPQITVI